MTAKILPMTGPTDTAADRVVAATLALQAQYPRLATQHVFHARTVGEAVGRLRRLLGLSQRELSDALHQTAPQTPCADSAHMHLARIEGGSAAPSCDTLDALALLMRLPHVAEAELRCLPFRRDMAAIRASVALALADDDVLLDVAEHLGLA